MLPCQGVVKNKDVILGDHIIVLFLTQLITSKYIMELAF